MSHTFGSQNIRHSENERLLKASLHRVVDINPDDLDVIAMQELSGARKGWVLQALPGWRLHHKAVQEGAQNGTGIAWDNARWELVRKGVRVVYRPHRDGPVERYNGRDQPQWRRFASWVTLRDRLTGNVRSFISFHGKLGAAGAGAQWRHLRRLIRHLQTFGAVLVAGDFNAWLLQLPDWAQEAMLVNERIDSILGFGIEKVQKFVHTRAEMNAHGEIVDHAGVAVRWRAA